MVFLGGGKKLIVFYFMDLRNNVLDYVFFDIKMILIFFYFQKEFLQYFLLGMFVIVFYNY